MASRHILDAVRKAGEVGWRARLSIPRSASRVCVDYIGGRCLDQRGSGSHGSQLARRDTLRVSSFDRRPGATGGQRDRSFAPGSGEGLSLR